jgi:hypothetical protein
MKSARFENSSIMVLLPERIPMHNQFPDIFIELLKKKMEEYRIPSEPTLFQIEDHPDRLYENHSLSLQESIENFVSENDIGLSCVIGNTFSNTGINRILAGKLDEGMRMVVLSNDIEYIHLAEYLGVSNIKHKARIEKIDINSSDNNSISIVSDIIDDELRRITL